MCNFFKYAKRHSHLKQVIIDNSDVVKKTKLVGLCTTRFVERHESILVAKELLPYVAISLSHIESWDTEDTRKSATNLLNSIQKPAFLVGLIMLEMVSGIIKPVSASLQSILSPTL